MGTSADKLNKIINTKNAIKTAINDKYTTPPIADNTKFADYAAAITNIPSGGGSSYQIKTGSFTVPSSGNISISVDFSPRFIYFYGEDDGLSGAFSDGSIVTIAISSSNISKTTDPITFLFMPAASYRGHYMYYIIVG